MYRIGVDIGGTFTDFALFDARGSTMSVHKRLTTPHDPSEAVTEGIAVLLKDNGVAIADVTDVVHGTTLVTNAVIERRGAVTGMLATAGFGDILDMGFERRYDLFDLRVKYPPPLVPRRLRLEVPERVRFDGSIERPLDESAVGQAARRFRELGVTAVAVCFLHSYANAAHETRAAEILREAAPELFVSTSANVFPNMREFERWTTTTVNAFTQPMFDRYLERLEKALAAQGFGGRLYIMSSSGGTLTTDTARRFPVRALESGPAAGALMSAYHGRSLDLSNLLSFDMGGTTAKGALVRGGVPIKRYSMEVARVHEFRQGSGLTIRIPAIDMIEIGAGGGSIAEIDDRGLLRVGPRSAGADPGPACYGQGGARPTLTDANLVLGYLDAGFLPRRCHAARSLGGGGGGPGACRQAARSRAAAGGMGHPRYRQRGRGARLPHPCDRARLRLPLRQHGGVRRLRTAARARHCRQAQNSARDLPRRRRRDVCARPADQPARIRDGAVAADPRRRYRRRRFHGDVPRAGGGGEILSPERRRRRARHPPDAPARHALPGPGPRDRGDAAARRRTPGALFAELGELFGRAYQAAYTLRLEEPAEIVNWKVEAVGPAPDLGPGYSLSGPAGTAKALKGARLAYDPGSSRLIEWPVYDRYALAPGASVTGPALIEERESTCVIDSGHVATVDARYNLVADLGA